MGDSDAQIFRVVAVHGSYESALLMLQFPRLENTRPKNGPQQGDALYRERRGLGWRRCLGVEVSQKENTTSLIMKIVGFLSSNLYADQETPSNGGVPTNSMLKSAGLPFKNEPLAHRPRRVMPRGCAKPVAQPRIDKEGIPRRCHELRSLGGDDKVDAVLREVWVITVEGAALKCSRPVCAPMHATHPPPTPATGANSRLRRVAVPPAADSRELSARPAQIGPKRPRAAGRKFNVPWLFG